MIVDAHLHVATNIPAQKLLAYLDRAQIDKAVLLGSSLFTFTLNHRHGFVQYSENNTHILKMRRSHPDRIVAWPTLHPADGNNVWRATDYAEKGATGIKLYVGHGAINRRSGKEIFHVCRIDDDALMKVYEFCQTSRMMICLHVNCGKPDYWAELLRVLDSFPRLRVVVPHLALSSRSPDRLVHLMENYDNVYTDVSFGQDEFMRAGALAIEKSQRLCKLLSRYAGRILFGTDLVLTTARHKTPQWAAERVEHYRNMLATHRYWSKPFGREFKGAGLPPKVLDKIFGGNLLALVASQALPGR